MAPFLMTSAVRGASPATMSTLRCSPPAESANASAASSSPCTAVTSSRLRTAPLCSSLIDSR